MLDPQDARWDGLAGGYRVAYDPRPALAALEADWTNEAAWQELWGELHHQGDVGEASYAAIPTLVAIAAEVPQHDWNLYALAAIIEVERHRRSNPELPWLSEMYGAAWASLVSLATWEVQQTRDRLVIQSALAVIALGRGALKVGALLAGTDLTEVDDYLNEHLAWSTLYDESRVPPTSES